MSRRPGVDKAPVKRTSVLRRVPPIAQLFPRPTRALEGDVCLFQLGPSASPIVVESDVGRAMTIVAGDAFLAVPGHRESTRWVVGGIPDGGLIPGRDYWVLAASGVVGKLIGNSPLEHSHLAPVKYLGALRAGRGKTLNIRQFVATASGRATDRRARLFLVVGTSSEVGKTTAAVAVLRALRQQGHASVVVLKATGTSSISELATYLDYGAAHAFDCIDFGLPTTYPSDRDGAHAFFDAALDVCLSMPANAVIVECGGDLLGANVPEFLECLKLRRPDPNVILVAPDALAALGAKRVLHEMGLAIDLIAGPCTDTPTLRERTQALCGVPALNLAGGQPAPL
ncbi:MAG: DUF1611 domain-containing protein [Proteobacteria bacterium]|nr:DUF1611 domain-containing protein [Pseudomonadota bacterium]